MESVSCPLVVPGISSLVFHIYGISEHSAKMPVLSTNFIGGLWGHLSHFAFRMTQTDLVNMGGVIWVILCLR
jgi:hypothetical protein